MSVPYTGWGTAWFDFDNDGWLDLLSVNGTIVAVNDAAPQSFPYNQRKVLFRNLRDGRFEDVTGQAGAVFKLSESGRGAAFGDIDNDGDMDVLVGNDGGRVRLLVNNLGSRNHWLGLRLVGKAAGRDMLGARVAVSRDGSTIWRRARVRWQLRLGQRSARARRPRLVDGTSHRQGPLARRPLRRVVRRRDRSMDHVEGRHRPVRPRAIVIAALVLAGRVCAPG